MKQPTWRHILSKSRQYAMPMRHIVEGSATGKDKTCTRCGMIDVRPITGVLNYERPMCSVCASKEEADA